MRNFLAGVMMLLVMGCSSDKATGPNATVNGTWAGNVGGQTLTLTFVQSSTSVTGNGTLTNTPSGTRALAASGTFTGDKLNATLTSGTIQPIALAATLKNGTLSGSLQGSGFTGEAILMYKQ